MKVHLAQRQAETGHRCQRFQFALDKKNGVTYCLKSRGQDQVDWIGFCKELADHALGLPKKTQKFSLYLVLKKKGKK